MHSLKGGMGDVVEIVLSFGMVYSSVCVRQLSAFSCKASSPSIIFLLFLPQFHKPSFWINVCLRGWDSSVLTAASGCTTVTPTPHTHKVVCVYFHQSEDS